MSFCSKCGNKLNGTETYCVKCGMTVNINNMDYMTKVNKKSKTPMVLAIISFVFAILPILLLVWLIVASETSSDPSGGSAGGFILGLYYWTIGVPIAISALILGIISYKKEKNKLALCSIIIDFLPYLYFIFLIIKNGN